MHKSAPAQALKPIDHGLLAAALALGIAASLRTWGVAAVSFPAAALLAGAAALAIRPLVRLFRRGVPIESRRRPILLVIFGAHLVATLFFFPPEDILNDRPILTLDHSLHFYQTERAKEVFWNTGRLYTYDPCFMAGHPGGAIFDIDSKGVELWCALLRYVPTPVAFKLFVLLGHLLLPCTVYAACRRLRFGFDETVYTLLVLLAYWHWGRPYAGHFRFAGMFSYLVVCHLSLYLTGLMRAFIDGEAVKRFYVLGPLAFFIHPTAAVLLAAPFLALLLTAPRRMRGGRASAGWGRRLAARIALWFLVVLAVNAVWLVPLARYIDIKVSSETFFQLGGLGALAVVLVKPGNLPALLLLALAAGGLAVLACDRRLAAAAGPAAGAAFLLFLAAFGVYVPLFNQMEPGRFLVPALVFMAPLSGAGAALIMGKRKSDAGAAGGESWGAAPQGAASSSNDAPASGKPRSPELAAGARTAAVILFVIASPALSLAASRAFYRHTLTTTFTPAARELIETLERRTNAGGRLMIEDGPAWAYGNTFLPALLPLYTRVEQIGGPYPFTFIRHSFASFRTCEAFGSPVRDADPRRFGEYLELYNVRWILTATPECAAAFESFQCLSRAWESATFTLWDVARPPTDTAESGAAPEAAPRQPAAPPDDASSPETPPNGGFASESCASVRSSYGLIHVTISAHCASRTGSILLKYHWDKGLRVSPPARISPVMQIDDPVPFILLEPGGARDIRITFEG